MDTLIQLVDWFTSSGRWVGSAGIPVRVGQHVWYAFAATGAAAAIALPTGIGLGHLGRGGLLAINISNIGRAVPVLGLIILVVILSGIGYLPVFVALTALAIPPILTNSYTAMQAVDAEVKDAAVGMGMTRWQRLWQAEVPIALPLILAGIRTAALQVVATATLAALVGLGGLGRYLIDGLANQDYPQVLGGAILVALLALTVDFVFGRLQALILPQGLAARSGRTGQAARAQKAA